MWSRVDRPRADRWLGPADVVHGTNYVAPPSTKPTVISVYDCWFLRHPADANPLVRRAAKTLRRRVAEGAWVHTSSDATADAARELLDTDRVESILLGPPPSVSEPVADAPASVDPDLERELRGAPFLGHLVPVNPLGGQRRADTVDGLVDSAGHSAKLIATLERKALA